MERNAGSDRQTKIANMLCSLAGKRTSKFHLLQSVSRRIFMFAKEHSKVCLELPETIRVTPNTLPLQGTELFSEVG